MQYFHFLKDINIKIIKKLQKIAIFPERTE